MTDRMLQVGALQITTPSDREIAMTRLFDAPRRLVYDAYTKPELVRRWAAGPEGWSFAECEMDVRVGGTWRWLLLGPSGERMGLGGVYQEVVPLEKIASTEAYDEPWYEGEAVSSVTFADNGAGTRITVRVRYASQAVRDAVLQTPMAYGMAAGLDAMERLLATLS